MLEVVVLVVILHLVQAVQVVAGLVRLHLVLQHQELQILAVAVAVLVLVQLMEALAVQVL